MSDAHNDNSGTLGSRLKQIAETELRIGSWRVYGAAFVAASAIGGAALLLGLVLGINNMFPSTLVSKVQNRLLSPEPVGVKSSGLWTVYIPLNVVETQLTRKRQNASGGGGLTEFGSDSVLLAYDGRFVAIDSDGKADPLEISPPDNGYDAYLAFAQRPENQARDYLTQHHRYNDVLHFDNGVRAGLVISYTEFHADEACMTNTLALLTLEPGIADPRALSASAEDWQIMHRTSPCLEMNDEPYWPFFVQMGGGRMEMASDGELIFTSGDFHRDGVYSDQNVSQDPDAEYGKVMGLDLETGTVRQISLGHRNPQGIVIDQDDQIWVTEHGPKGGDELNLVREGANYGWPLEALGTLYNNAPWPDQVSYARHTTFEDPIFAFVPSIGISALAQVENFSPAWDGDFLVASLKDAHLYRMRVRDNRVMMSERIWINGQRIRYVLAHSEGRIVLWTDDDVVVTVTPSADSHASDSVAAYIDELDVSAQRKQRVADVLDGCQMCHAMNPNDNQGAPNLANVFDRDIGSTPYPGYSNALRSINGKWTRGRLREYLADPASFAPGTTMPNSGLTDPETIEDVIDLLALRGVPAAAMLDEGRRQIERDKDD
ncbi:MAG: PQQ-dependent sugar dehydrogenase [Pseudomonadota bacterium]